MHRVLLLAFCLGLAACAGGSGPVVTPHLAGGNRADGIVAMSSTVSIHNPVAPDWRQGQAGADRRCRGWGRDGAQSFAGWREACRRYDRHGRCVITEVTRFYACDG